MNKDEYTSRLQKIEEAINRIIPDKPDAHWLNLISGSSKNYTSYDSLSRILQPARTLLERGGKRWRPVMMVCLCELMGGGERAYPLSPLVELSHNGSLIIDDIEDSSEIRRGGKAVHLIFGTDQAINCGNFLYFLPTAILEEINLPVDKKNILLSIYMENMRRLHLGQGLDILWHRDPLYCPTQEEYLQMCSYKTGSLARMAAQMGVACAVEEKELYMVFGSLAEKVGVAFQILDDVMNLTTGNPGKLRGDDIVEGKKSLPVILYLRKQDTKKNFLLDSMNRAKTLGPKKGIKEIEKAIQVLEESGSLQEAENQAKKILLESAQTIKDKTETSVPRDLLLSIINGFLGSNG